MDEMNAFPDLWYRQNLKVKKDEARKCISEFINADPEDVVFVENATTGI
jgi:selenocysteine lyase/cysteine desulfurase